jgi:hypothetical protein
MSTVPAPSPYLQLPPDAAELMAEAQRREGLKDFRHGSDCVIARQADGKYLHQTHRQLRERLAARLKSAGATA